MDYQALLLKYMQHVRDEESVTYTQFRPEQESYREQVDFTDEEWGELQRIAAMTIDRS